MLFNNVTNELYDGKETASWSCRSIASASSSSGFPRTMAAGSSACTRRRSRKCRSRPAEGCRQEGLRQAAHRGWERPRGDLQHLLAPPPARRLDASASSSRWRRRRSARYKKWMTMAREIQVIKDEARGPETPPLWSHKYRLTTFYHQKKNQSWYKWFAKLRRRQCRDRASRGHRSHLRTGQAVPPHAPHRPGDGKLPEPGRQTSPKQATTSRCSVPERLSRGVTLDSAR
jgi:hypothetical protein